MFAPATMPVSPIKLSDDQWQYLEQIRDQKAPRFVSEKPPSASTNQDQYTLARDSFQRFRTVVDGRSRSASIEDAGQARAILLQLSSYTPVLQDRGVHDRLKAQLEAFMAKATEGTEPKKEEPQRVGWGAVGQDSRFARDAREVTGRHGMTGAAGVGGVKLPQSEDLTKADTKGWYNLPNRINPQTEVEVLLNALRAIPGLANRDKLLREYDAFFKSNALITTVLKKEKLANLLHMISAHDVALARANTRAYEAFKALTEPWKGTASKPNLQPKKALPSGERLEAFGLGIVTETKSRAEKIPQNQARPLSAETVRDIARELLQDWHNALVGVYAGRVDNSALAGEFRGVEVVFRRVIQISGQTFTLILGRLEQSTIRPTPVSTPHPAAVSIPADKPGDPVAIYGDKAVAELSGKGDTYEVQATSGVGEDVVSKTRESFLVALGEYRAHKDPRYARQLIAILLTIRQAESRNVAYKEVFLHDLIQKVERERELNALIKTHFTGSSGALTTVEELRAISNIARGLSAHPGHHGGMDKEGKE